MTDDLDIFKRLGQYEAEPPAGMFLRIVKSLDDDSGIEDAGNGASLTGGILQLQEMEVPPPAWLLSSIETEIASSQLFLVRELESHPPEKAFATIMRSIGTNGKDTRKEDILTGFFSRHRYKWVAAAVILVVSGWFIDRLATFSGKIKKEVAIQTNSQPPASGTGEAPVARVATKKDSIVRKSSFVVSANDFFYTRRVSIDDYKFPLVDDDLLTTFAGFGYEEMPGFAGGRSGNMFRIKVDQYSNITVSESMSRMIRNMNQFRKNKKPTRRARRERAKLERWKKTDTNQFDKTLIKNPLDAIDLAEYIF